MVGHSETIYLDLKSAYSDTPLIFKTPLHALAFSIALLSILTDTKL